MAIGTIGGAELGAQLIQALKHAGNVNFVVSVVSIAVYVSISGFMIWESWRTLAHSKPSKLRKRSGTAIIKRDQSAFYARDQGTPATTRLADGPSSNLRGDDLPLDNCPRFLCRRIVQRISRWWGGLHSNALAVYVLGIPTHLAVGTDLFEIIISASYGTFTHAIKGNVDILIALVMHTGAAIGAQIGAIATQYFGRPKDPTRVRAAAADRRCNRHLHSTERPQAMTILICSDGTPPSDNAIHIGGLLANATHARATLLGIAEQSVDEAALRQALEKQATALLNVGVDPRIVLASGDRSYKSCPNRLRNKYDLVVIGARHKESSGLFWRSQRTYELIKAVEPPVMVAIGKCERLARFLVCTGGKYYIDEAVNLTANLAAALHAEVTLLHVMPEPPAIFPNLAQMESDVDCPARLRLRPRAKFVRAKRGLSKTGCGPFIFVLGTASSSTKYSKR